MVMYQSAITSRPLRIELNIDHLTAVQCSCGKLCGCFLITQTVLQSTAHSDGSGGPPAGQCDPATPPQQLRNVVTQA